MEFGTIYLKLLFNTNNSLYCELYSYILNKNNKKRKIYENMCIFDDIIKIIGIKDILHTEIDLINNKSDNIYIQYTRVSSLKQADNNSCLNQLSIINDCLEKRKLDYNNNYHFYEFDSAYTKIPSKLKLIIETLKNICICFSHIDRFSRNITFFQTEIAPLLKQNNIKILICGENGCYGSDYSFNNVQTYEYDVLNFIQKIIPFQIESCRKSVRSKEIHTYMKQNNIPSRKEFGYDIVKTDKKHLIINNVEQNILEIIATLKDGNVSAKKANEIMQKLYNKLYSHKLYVPFNFYSKNNTIDTHLDANGMSFENIALLLNDYELPYSDTNNWTKNIVARQYNKYNNKYINKFNMITID